MLRTLVNSLRGRFLLAGALVVIATIASATWSVTMFARLADVVDDTVRASEQLIEHAATLASGLEREDDALLLALAGQTDPAQRELTAERAVGDDALRRLEELIVDDADRQIAATLRDNIVNYRALGDDLMRMAARQPGEPEAYEHYHQTVNPALRDAVTDAAGLRESGFRAMQAAGVSARDAARRATGIVATIAVGALLLSLTAAGYLARTVLRPISELTDSVHALRRGDFDRRVSAGGIEELGRLAAGFNRMADSLATFRRTNLGEVLRAKETLEATLRALPDAVLVVGLDGRVESANPAATALFGAAGALESVQLADLPLPEDVVQAVIAQRPVPAASGPAVIAEAIAIEQRSGWRRQFQPVVVPLPELSTGPLGTLLVLHDVTDFHRLDELRADLIGVTSHELKTPLTTLRVNLLLLAEKAENLAPREREILAAAADGCEQLAARVDQLLDLSRIEAGQLRLSLSRIDVHEVIDHAVAMLRSRFDEYGVALKVMHDTDPALTLGDSERLGIVFSNLLSNALKFTSQGGEVGIQVHGSKGPDTDKVTVTVTDTGRGVPAELRERIFEKFYRVDQQGMSADPPVPGVGIGLYLCRQIVDAHDGSIHCEAADDDRGTRFVISLPSNAD